MTDDVENLLPRDLLEPADFLYYNKKMVSGFPFNDEWQSRSHVRALFGAARWNQYVSNWSVTLAALRHLWKMGKVSELKSPYYDLVDRSKNNRL